MFRYDFDLQGSSYFTSEKRGYCGANFLTSDDFQILMVYSTMKWCANLPNFKASMIFSQDAPCSMPLSNHQQR